MRISKKSLVSVIIPTFNRAAILPNAMDSVYEQTYRPIEMIIIDDGSKEDIQAVVKNWTDKNSRNDDFSTRYIYQKNAGANAARNKGIALATGEYIAFLDSDDRWLPKKLTLQMDAFKNDPDLGDVYCGLYHMELESGLRLPDPQIDCPSGWLTRSLLIHDVTTPTSCHVVRRDCFKDVGCFDESLPARQDWDMWIRLASKYQFTYVPELLVEQREHLGDRVRSNPNNEIRAARQIFKKYADFRRQQPFWVSLAARSAMYRRRGRVYFHQRISTPRAIGLQILAICIWPFTFDSYAALAGIFMPNGFRQKVHIFWNKLFGKTFLAIKSH